MVGETKTTQCLHCGVGLSYRPYELYGISLEPTVCDSCCDAYKAQRNQRAIDEAKRERFDRFKELCPKEKWSFISDRFPSNLGIYENCLAHDLSKQGLLIHGVSRVGKSLTAWQLARKWVESGQIVRCLRDVQFGRLIERAYSEGHNAHDKLIVGLSTVPLLYIDDLGKAKMTHRVETDLFDVIDKRYEEQRPMLVTTQFTGDRLIARFSCKETGIATLERLRECCEIINLKTNENSTAIRRI